MNKKTIALGYWIVLLAFIVVATAPTIPTTISPANNTNFMGTATLTCGGSTDPESDDFTYLFWHIFNSTNNVLLQNSTNTSFSMNGYNPTSEWSILNSGSAPTFTYGSSTSNPYKLKGGDGTNNATASFKFNSNSFFVYIGLEGTGNWMNVSIDGTKIYGETHTGTYSANWREINVSTYNDNAVHQLTFITNPADNVNDYITWWLLPNNVNWSCQACDNNSECSSNVTRYYNPVTFGYCSGADNTALSLTFESENNTGTKINGAMNNIALTFVDDSTSGYSFSYSNSSQLANYTFCMSPNTTSLSTSGTISYSATGYPQRTASLDRYLNGSYAYPKTLYLLPMLDGIYSTILVVDASSQEAISGVFVTAEKLISGTYVEVTSGITDDTGSATFWVDSNTQHRFTFTKSGYQSALATLTPTQSIYTQSLVPITSINESSYYQGIIYTLTPTDSVLSQNTTYNFGLNLTSNYWNLTSYGFQLVNSSGDVLIDTSAGVAGGSYINQTYSTTSNSRLTMYYYWTAEGNTINNSYYWQVRNTSQGSASLANFFDDLKTFNKGGADDFTRVLIYLFIIIVILATLVWFAGDSGYVEYTILIAVVLLVWLGEYIELIPTIGEKYFITIIMGLVVGAYLITDNIR